MPCVYLSEMRLNVSDEADEEFIKNLYEKDNEKMAAAEKDLETKIKTLGENHPDVAGSYTDLGFAYCNRLEYDRAVDCYQKALEINIKTLGPVHPELAELYKTLGNTCSNKGDDEQAILYHQKSWEILKTHLGENHPDTKEIKLTIEYMKTDLLAKGLGEGHPDLATPYNDLANAYYEHGKYYLAIEYYQKSLEIQTKTMGEDHLDVAMTYHNLGKAYYDDYNYDQAVEQYQKSLAIRIKALGEEHPEVAKSYHNLGLVCNKRSEYIQAIEYYQKSLEILLKTVGENHPDVAVPCINIGLFYNEQGEYDRAIQYLQRALEICHNALKPDHPYMPVVYSCLGSVYRDKGEYDQAIEYYQKALELNRMALGADDPRTKGIERIIEDIMELRNPKSSTLMLDMSFKDSAAVLSDSEENDDWSPDDEDEYFKEIEEMLKDSPENTDDIYDKNIEPVNTELRKDAELSFFDKDTGEKKSTLQVEIPETREEQARGLMGRSEIPDHQGMLFVDDKEDIIVMWTKDTLIPTDIIFANKNNIIVSISENNAPLSKEYIYSEEESCFAIETKAGFCEKNSIHCGDSIKTIR